MEEYFLTYILTIQVIHKYNLIKHNFTLFIRPLSIDLPSPIIRENGLWQCSAHHFRAHCWPSLCVPTERQTSTRTFVWYICTYLFKLYLLNIYNIHGISKLSVKDLIVNILNLADVI